MGEMRIIDVTGDSCLAWTEEDVEAISRAETRFNQLVRDGNHTAFEVLPGGKSKKTEVFDPSAGKLTVIPRLAGG